MPAKPAKNPHDIDEQLLRDFVVRLLAVVRGRAKWLFARFRSSNDDLGIGVQCQDIVNECLASLFVSPNQWDPQKEPDPWRHLVSLANSKLVNLKMKLVRRERLGEDVTHTTARRLEDIASDNGDRREVDIVNLAQSNEPDAFEILQLEQLDAAITDVLLDYGEDELMNLYDIACELGELPPSRCAERLRVDARVVDNLKKRLARRVREAIARMGLVLGGNAAIVKGEP
jgi:DNA-directed RNA polymerase specialized sigma24 family protein